jgi:hypothetical protein
MTNPTDLKRLSNHELLERLCSLVARSNELEAEIIEHLAEIDERRLYLERAHPSLFAFCTSELGFSEAVAQNRILVARASRRFPRMLELLRAGQVHASGLRLLAPHLDAKNCEALLAQAIGKTKRQIEEALAANFPVPPAPDAVRKLPERRPQPEAADQPPPSAPAPQAPSTPPAEPTPAPLLLAPPPERLLEARFARIDHRLGLPHALRARGPSPRRVEPLSAEHFRVQFTADRALRDKLEQAQQLLRHQVPDGNLATIFERALDLLIGEIKKQRFGLGRKARPRTPTAGAVPSRHVPAAIRRAVYERDGGQCSFVDPRGRRCPERGFLEIDHVAGFARQPEHSVQSCRLLCRFHNGHAAELLYGRRFMHQKRNAKAPP